MTADTNKLLLSATVSALVAGTGSWVAFGRTAITKDDLATMGPWPLERGALIERVDGLEGGQAALLAELKALGLKIEAVADRQNALLVEQRVLRAQVEEFLKRDGK